MKPELFKKLIKSVKEATEMVRKKEAMRKLQNEIELDRAFRRRGPSPDPYGEFNHYD